MPCKLHNLLEAIEYRQIWMPVSAPRSVHDEVTRYVRQHAPEAMCFDCGDYEELGGYKLIPALVKFPYPTCYFEFSFTNNSGPGNIGVLCAETEGQRTAKLFGKCVGSNGWRYIGGAVMTEISDAGIEWAIATGAAGQDLLGGFLALMAVFLGALNCTVNINRVEHKPDETLQKARRKRGQQPLFSYWTLEIDLSKSRAAGEDYGGTHAAPRLHLRRGHPRQYKPGLWCWVQPCVVGNKKLGMVHKEYLAKHRPSPDLDFSA